MLPEMQEAQPAASAHQGSSSPPGEAVTRNSKVGARERLRRAQVPCVCILLAAITWIVFGQTLGHQFVNYDDPDYVYENRAIKGGLSLKGIGWAFTHVHASNWHPLTTISHMLDCQLYGLNPRGHHLTNLLLHAAAAILLFQVLRQMTGSLWRSAFVAAVFAIHPLRVQSVAWVAERKDVLSGVFFMLTLGAYVRYVQQSKAQAPVSKVWYGLGLGLFGLGLMCKPTLVTVPFVLLLLDYWPLRRFPAVAGSRRLLGIPARLITEKIPWLGLSAVSCMATLLAEEKTMGLPVSFAERVANALVSYASYLWQMVYPRHLAVFYPHPTSGLPPAEVLIALLLLAAISAVVFFWQKRQPWLAVGWLWYLGMLVPMIGMIQVGAQAQADRYTYLSQIGLYLLLTWTAAERCAGLRHGRWALGALSMIVIAALMWCARIQTAYWRDSQTLWNHTLECTQGNYIAHNNLGLESLQKGKVDEAIAHLQKAVEIQPRLAEAQTGVGYALLKKGEAKEAGSHFQRALELQPRSAEAQAGLANALCKQGQIDEAVARWHKALEINPDYAEAHANLGDALSQQGRGSEAIIQYQELVTLEPGDAHAQFSLGRALEAAGRIREAIAHYRAALKINYQTLQPLNNLGWILATSSDASIRNGSEAVKLAQEADRVSGGGNAGILDTLAAAYAEAGRFSEAVKTAERALNLAIRDGNKTLAEALRKELGLYQAGLPCHKAP